MSSAQQHRRRELGRLAMPDAAEGQAVGVVVSVGRGDLHAVDLQIGAVTRRVLCRRSGRLNTRHIRLIEGDRCTVEVDAYDPTKGRIVRRLEPSGTRP